MNDRDRIVGQVGDWATDLLVGGAGHPLPCRCVDGNGSSTEVVVTVRVASESAERIARHVVMALRHGLSFDPPREGATGDEVVGVVFRPGSAEWVHVDIRFTVQHGPDISAV